MGTSNTFSWGSTSNDDKKQNEEKQENTNTKAKDNSFSFGSSAPANNQSVQPAASTNFSFGTNTSNKEKDKDSQTQTEQKQSEPAKASDSTQTNASNQNKQQQNDANNNQKEQKDPTSHFNEYSVSEILSRWESDLEKDVNSYIKHGAQIRHWDKKLFDNSSLIINLQKEVADLAQTQCSFNKELERVRGQQQNLNDIIEELEKTLGTTPTSSAAICGMDANNSNLVSMLSPNVMNMSMTHSGISDPSLNRNDVYSMAETIDQNLTSLNERLQIKINELNQTNESFKNSKHPLTPVVDILNNQIASITFKHICQDNGNHFVITIKLITTFFFSFN